MVNLAYIFTGGFLYKGTFNASMYVYCLEASKYPHHYSIVQHWLHIPTLTRVTDRCEMYPYISPYVPPEREVC